MSRLRGAAVLALPIPRRSPNGVRFRSYKAVADLADSVGHLLSIAHHLKGKFPMDHPVHLSILQLERNYNNLE